MEAKYFNNVIIGQFVLTGVPVKVYTGTRYLTITDADDVEDPTFGFGMDEDGDMQRFDYRNVMELIVSGNRVDLETYNKGMEAKFGNGEEEEEDTEEEKEEETEDTEEDEAELKDHFMPSIKEISKDVLKAKLDVIKKQRKELDDKEAALKKEPIEEGHNYTFGVGDIVKNRNTSCPHHGSMGVVKKIMDLPGEVGTVAIYTVMNSGSTYKPGDSLTKTVDQLEPITSVDSLEEDKKMEDPNKNSLDYKVPKLKDLIKGAGYEEIPKKVFDSEATDDTKDRFDAKIKALKDEIKELEKQKKEMNDGKKG